MDQNIRLLYDKEADVLYVTSGEPLYTDYEEVGENLILRRDPKTKQIVGFTVIDFAAHFARQEPPLSVPLEAKFAQRKNGKKTKIVAERKTVYQTRSKRITH